MNRYRTVKPTSRTKYGTRRITAEVPKIDQDWTQAVTIVEIDTERDSVEATVRVAVHNCTEDEWNTIDSEVTRVSGSAWKEIKVGNTRMVIFEPSSLTRNADEKMFAAV